MLNEAQERNLSVTLRIVEDRLRDIDQMIEADDYKGLLKETKNDVPVAAKDSMHEKTTLIMGRIKMLTERFNLVKDQNEVSRLALARLSYCWEILEDAKTIKMKRYGDIHDGLAVILDPELDAIINLILEMEHLLRGF